MKRNRFIQFMLLVLFALGRLQTNGQAVGSTSQETANVENSPSTSTNLSANYGDIAMADNGSYVVAFQQLESSGSSNGTEIKFGVSTVASGYAEVGVVNTAKSNNQLKPKVAASADGSAFAIAWQSQTGSGATTYNIFVKTYGNINGPTYTGSSDIQVNSTSVQTNTLMDIAMDANGDFVVAWIDAAGDHIYAQRFNSSGTKQGGIITVDTFYGAGDYHFDVAMDASGEFVITWYDARTEDTSGGIFAKKYNADGSVQNATFLVNHTTSGYQGGGYVAMANTGEFIISYFSNTSEHYYKRYNAAGTQVGSQHQFTPEGYTVYSITGLGIDANLNYIVQFSVSSAGIYTQRFDSNDVLMGGTTQIASSSGTGRMAIDRENTDYVCFVRTGQITSSPVQYSIQAYRNGLCIGNPGAITGDQSVCPGQSSVDYYIAAVSGATSYSWTLSDASKATFTDGTISRTTASPTVAIDYDDTNTGSVTLTVSASGFSSCGESPVSSDLEITSSSISAPGAITGSTTVVENSLKTYSITAVSGAVGYNWTLPAGATIDTNNGNSIIVQFGTQSGSISVTATDECGNVTASSTKSVTVQALDTTPPQILSLTPAHGSDGVALNTGSYTIRFDESVTFSSGVTIALKTGTSKLSTTVATANSTSGVSGSNKAGYTINFGTVSLTAGSNYFLEIPANLFKDSQNNFFAGTTISTWAFTANRLPTNISLTNATVTDGDVSGTLVGTFSATDVDAHQTYTYQLISGTGSTDNAKFEISGKDLLTAAAVDYETQTSYSIRVRVTDTAGGTFDKVLTITVTDVDDQGPIHVSSIPANNATNVEPGDLIEITFDENIQYRTDLTTNIYLKRNTVTERIWINDPVNGNTAYVATIADNTIYLDVGNPLSFNTTYVLQSFDMSDVHGNIGSSEEVTFTTRPAKTEAEILTFSLPGMVGDAVIDEATNTITATMGAFASNVQIPTATYSDGATCSLTDGNAHTFNRTSTTYFIVYSEARTNQVWQINLAWESFGGDYTVGPNGNFSEINTALADLYIQGISSDVNLKVEDGYSYDGALDLYSIPGNDTYTVTIMPQDNASNITFSNSSSNPVVDFKTSKGYIFDGADPVSGARAFTFAITEGVTLQTINLGFSGNGAIKNSIIEVAQYGVYTASTTQLQSDYEVSGNEFIFKNTSSAASLYGVYFRWTRTSNCVVSGNIMYQDAAAPDAAGLTGIYGGSLIVHNNAIIGRADYFNGIYLILDSYPGEIMHNTVISTGTEVGTGTPGDIYGILAAKNSAGLSLKMQNNLVQLARSYTSANWKRSGIFYNSSQTNSAVDYNNIEVLNDGVSQGYYVKNGSLYYDELSDFSALMPNTTIAPMTFTDLANGEAKLSGASLGQADLRSTLVLLNADLEGNTRSTVAPSKGAYEAANILADITAFSFTNQKEAAIIDHENHTITAEMDDAGDVSSVNPTIAISPGASISPVSGANQDFTNPVNYTVTAEAGNEQVWTVTISEGDHLGPQVTSFVSPADLATNVSPDANIIIAFDEPIVKATGNVIIKANNLVVLETIDIQSEQITISGNELTINPTNPIFHGFSVSVAIDAGALEDASGNDYAGLLFNDLNFSIRAAYEQTEVSPLDGAVGVSANSSIQMIFNGAIFKTNSESELDGLSIVNLTDNTTQIIPANSSMISVQGNTAVINLTEPLAYLKEYKILVRNSVFKDEFGFTVGSIHSNVALPAGVDTNHDDQWTFTTEDYPYIEWDGTAWNNGSGPNDQQDVVISGDFTGEFRCSNLEIGEDVTVTITGVLFIDSDFNNNGSLIIESGASLFTFESYKQDGNVAIKRNTRYADGRYSFVGTPVQQNMGTTGADLGSYVYRYDETVPYGQNDGLNRWTAAGNEELVPGVGYTQAMQQEIIFTGTPNVGSIVIEGTYTEDVDDANEGWNLVANPYAAAISVEAFLAGNEAITGAVYIWDDNGSNQTRGSNSDYIVANALAATQNSNAGHGDRYNQHLGSAQGFFVKLNSASETNIEFTESMRVEGENGDDHFFRKSDESPALMRINLTNEDGLFKQAVIGWVQDASADELSRAYDAEVFSYHAPFAMYSMKAGHQLAINGLPEETEEITLGFSVAEAGAYALEWDMSSNQPTDYLLKDNYTGVLISSGESVYHFTSAAGQFTDRFQLVKPAQILKTGDHETMIYAFGKTLYYRVAGFQPAQIEVYSLSGKQVAQSVVSGSTQLNLENLPSGVYLVTVGRETYKLMLK